MPTHEVINQVPALLDYNLYSGDAVLREAVRREGAPWIEDRAHRLGARLGSEEVIEWGFDANNYPPVLQTHNTRGERIDQVKFHPAWHQLMRLSVEFGVHNLPWAAPQEGAHVARAALMYLVGQNEAGHSCPISMTYAAVPTLRRQANLANIWVPRIASTEYDPRFIPSDQKLGALLGMAMTEKQGGSDVRANTSQAAPDGNGGSGEAYRLTGHKWFCSAPMCDAFLTLAQAPNGLSCFLLPRWKPDGTLNSFFIQRLKNKLGNRSNASSEIEFSDALAWLVGEEGRGVRTIVEMVNHTRLDCMLGSAGLFRQTLVQAAHHVRHRSAFGKLLIDQPLMQNVLTDLCLESEAATTFAMRVARAYDSDSESEHAFRRIATAVGKYWLCKRGPAYAAEALECWGGNGYVEDSIMPRLFREAPLNSIWEGSGNVICLDVLRAINHEPQTLEVLWAEIDLARGGNRAMDQAANRLRENYSRLAGEPTQARQLVEQFALTLQGSLLVRHAPVEVSDAFCATRLAGDWGHAFGTLPADVKMRTIIDRATMTES
jgi:putative acyl-CoA dehydrogenase